MRSIWKRLLLVTALICTFAAPLALQTTASAATEVFKNACALQGAAPSPACEAQSTEDPIAGQNGVIVKITSILAIVAGMMAVIFLVIGGLKYITSNGDSSGVASAKSTIIYALVGVVIALLARPIVSFVVTRF